MSIFRWAFAQPTELQKVNRSYSVVYIPTQNDKKDDVPSRLKSIGIVIAPLLTIWGSQPIVQWNTSAVFENGVLKLIASLAYLLLLNYLHFDIKISELKKQMESRRIRSRTGRKGYSALVLTAAVVLVILIILLVLQTLR